MPKAQASLRIPDLTQDWHGKIASSLPPMAAGSGPEARANIAEIDAFGHATGIPEDGRAQSPDPPIACRHGNRRHLVLPGERCGHAALTGMNIDVPEIVAKKIVTAIRRRRKDVYIGFPE
jgi:hypothetical protein